MLVISHRGNTAGSNPELENNPKHIKSILSYYDCEIDVWKINNNWFLGHDNPQYPIDISFFNHSGLWCHAKNLDALHHLLKFGITCFYHNIDNFTITSNGFIWTYPNRDVCHKSIIVDTDKNWQSKNYNCYAVCVDFV